MTLLRIDPSEYAIRHDVRLVLGLDRDVVVWRTNLGSHARPIDCDILQAVSAATSGLIGVVNATYDGVRVGRFIALEIKRPDARPTKDQLAFLRLVQNQGGVAALISSPSQAVAVVAQAKADPTYRGGDLS